MFSITKTSSGSVGVGFSACDTKTADTLAYIARNFGHLINRNESLSGPEMSERIVSVYGRQNPRIKCLLAILGKM